MSRLKILYTSIFSLTSFFFFSLHAASVPITQKPLPIDQTRYQEKLSLHSQRETANDFYELSLVNIEADDLLSAKEALHAAIRLDPNFLEAKIQLAYIYLWEKKLPHAENLLTQVILQDPKNPLAIAGLESIAHTWGQEKDFQKQAIYIYRKLLESIPNQGDYLFYLGRLLAQTKQWKEAEEVLLHCLSLFPQYVDADLQLGTLYVWQNRFDEAEEIFQNYPNNIEAKKDLARLSLRKGDFPTAEKRFSALATEYPNDEEVRYSLAKVYLAQNKFSEANKEYQVLIKKPTEALYRELFELKLLTHPALVADSTYTASKEDDPSLKAPVVRDFYFNNSLALWIPIYDCWRIDLKPYAGYQKERNIYRTGINYNVSLYGGIVNSHYTFHKNWRWDVSIAGVHGENIGSNHAYPFLTTTRVGIASDVVYSTESHTLVLDVHPEGLLVKDLARIESKLLSLTYADIYYKYRFNFFLKPEIEGYVEEVFYSDHIRNRRNTLRLITQCPLPFFDKAFTLSYEFERRMMPKLSINYYSFRRQWRHVMGVKFRKEFFERIIFEVFYYHRWQLTRRLYQPIGDFVYVAERQNLTSNKIGALIGYRIQDKCRFELSGHYFRDTLPYRDWNLHGTLIWEF
ncbi:MAG: tetratricopeptide repeat protein [Chlamydiota bacterium]